MDDASVPSAVRYRTNYFALLRVIMSAIDSITMSAPTPARLWWQSINQGRAKPIFRAITDAIRLVGLR